MRHIGLLAVFAAATLHAEDEAAAVARERAGEIRARCVTRLDGVPGVTSVSYAGSGTDYRLLISVQDYLAKAAVRQKLGGDSWEGLAVLWSVTSTQTVTAPKEEPERPPTPAPPPPATKPEPASPDAEPDCDIVRAQLGLPPLHRPVGGTSWKSWVPCKVWLRSVAGPGGGHSYLYAKHRPGCAYQDGPVSRVVREGFLTPTELRGSDVSWWRQVGQDVANKFPPPPPPMIPKTTFYRRDAPVEK
jgi:hypothetical protein